MQPITKEHYKEALKAEGVLIGRSLDLLFALYEAPLCMATPGQIAQIVGYQRFSPVNAMIGKLGKRRVA